MKGITIVEEHLCRVTEMSELLVICIFFTLLCAGILAIHRFQYKHSDSRGLSILIIVCSTVVVILCIVKCALQICNYNKTYYEYTIEVDDSVSFNDFFDRYEIVSVDGDRYRVKEINRMKE